MRSTSPFIALRGCAEMAIPLHAGVFILMLVMPKVAAADNPGRGLLRSTADSYIREEMPTSNFGDEPSLLVGPGQEFGYFQRALYHFDTDWLPDDATILSAELNLYMYHLPEAGPETLGLFVVEDSWQEADVTWETQPSTSIVMSQEVSDEAGWKTLDITALVHRWVNGENFGLMLTSGEGDDGGSDMSFYSREAPLCGPFVLVSYVTNEIPPESPEQPECDPSNDVHPPQIAISATPNPGVSDEELEITVAVTDDMALYRIQLMHGATVLEDRILTTDTAAETLTHRAVYGPGMHRFSVIAWDRNMNGRSDSIRVPVYVDGEPPQISVQHTPPVAAMGSTITIEATAEDPSGIAAMSIAVDGIMHDYLFDDAMTRKTISLDITAPSGTHVIRYYAYAVDEEGFYSSTGAKYALFGDSSGTDSDGDTISDEIEIALGTDPASNDTDNDGLYDHWEILGFDANRDGVVDLDLPAMGATPHHKDMFVEMDWMEDATHTHKLHPDAITAMVNLYREYGIRLHIDTGQLGGGNALLHDNNVKQCASGCSDCAISEWDWVASTKRDNFDPSRIGIFFYVVALHPCGFGPKARLDGNLMLPLDNGTTVARQVTFFFHELGHTVGLGHGGQVASSRSAKTLGPEGDLIDVTLDWAWDQENIKPNYLSNMSYRYQWYLRFLPEGGDPDFDSGDSIYVYSYSRVENEINENLLDESEGVDGRVSFGTYVWRRGLDVNENYVLYNERMRGTFYMWLSPEDTCPPYFENAADANWVLADGSPVDWSYNGVIDDAILTDYDINGHCKADAEICDCADSTMMNLVSRDEIPLLRTKIAASEEGIRFGFNPTTGGAYVEIPEAESTPDGTDDEIFPDTLATDAEYCDGADNDGDGLIDEGFADTDGDGIADEIDNCPFAENGDQSDMNHDGIGDMCDVLPLVPTGLALGDRGGPALTWASSPQAGQLGYNVYRQSPGEAGMVRLEPAFPTTLEGYYPIDCIVGTSFAVSSVDINMHESPLSDLVVLTADEADASGCRLEAVPRVEISCDDGRDCTVDAKNGSTGGCTHSVIPSCVEPVDAIAPDSGVVDTQDIGPDDGTESGLDTATELGGEVDTLLDSETASTIDPNGDAGTPTEIEGDSETGTVFVADSDTASSPEVLSEYDSASTTGDAADADAGIDAGLAETGHGKDGCGCSTAGHAAPTLQSLLRILWGG